MYQLDHDEPATAEDADQIADAFSAIYNWAETGEEVDPGVRVRASFELTELLEELGNAGWSVYAATTPRNLVMADKTVAWPTATIHIARTKRAVLEVSREMH